MSLASPLSPRLRVRSRRPLSRGDLIAGSIDQAEIEAALERFATGSGLFVHPVGSTHPKEARWRGRH
jgi:hypothetical protein